MDTEFGARTYIIVKGYIDAKNERGTPTFGTILAVVSRRELKHLSVMFSHDESYKSMEWGDLLLIHKNRENESARDSALSRDEGELFKYLAHSSVLSNIAKNYNTKQSEQAISRFCMDKLQLKAVSLIEFFDASNDAISLFERGGGSTARVSAGDVLTTEGKAPETAESDDHEVSSDDAGEPKGKEELIIRCEPILDPVGGIATNEINLGEVVMAKLPADSVFFKLLSKNIPGFDGVVSASVTGVLINELGTATISLALSDGITGVMKLSGKVKIKAVVGAREQQDADRGGPIDIPVEFVFVLAGTILFFCGIAVVYYILQ
ncbi:MAG: hypothetical protein LBS53_01815 [Synergistaceae bacterium]|jgi:hypothetical protein|nr:hypothetical protein [Synergistaceae bacterium]